jgi:surfactin synthase thioesterase subunit
LLGDEDPVLGVREAERWSEHTSGAFSVKVFPGGHFYFTDQPEAVAAFISNSL